MFLLDAVAIGTTYTCGNIPNLAIDGFLIRLIHLIYLGIEIAVPILLVIFGMLDLGKAVMAQKEDEIKKGQQMFVKRLIAAIIVFLVFFIVQLAIGLVATKDSEVSSCMKCFITGKVDEDACADSFTE